MNRFRTKKKAKEVPEHHGASEPAPLPSLPFIKGKKKQAETKPEIDLTSALPSSDDFRTSLLMPKMSARFSMLRDQDDPNSKMGKANDDSVIAPRRQSRLNLFGHPNNNQLADIAEVSSMAGSARPSMATERPSIASADAFSQDDDSSHGPSSIMDRTRPLEGNNLFGGRQKVYKIPVNSHRAEGDSSANDEAGAADRGSGSSGGGGGGSMGGKVVYESDIFQSAFQKQKQKERDERRRREAEALLTAAEEDVPAPSEDKPPSETGTTSTALPVQENINGQAPAASPPADSQAPAPAATQEQPNSDQYFTKRSPAATPEPDRNPSKPRRLYGQGLELHRQQSSAINRIEKANRQRAATNDAVQMNRSLSKSAMNLTEKYQQKHSPLYASSNFRPTSPPPSATSSISGNNIDAASKTNSGPGHSYLSPVSPPVSEAGEISPFAADLRPEDRGKATATGLFNKPASKYDEAQFSQRQLMMYEGRNTPPLRPSPSRAHSAQDTRATTADRSRGHSGASYQSGAESVPSRQSESAEEVRRSGDRSASASMRRVSPPKGATNGTFLANLSGSESDDDEDDRSLNSSVPSILHGSDSVHPALRTSTESGASSSYKSPHVSTPEVNKLADSRDLKTIEENETDENAQQSHHNHHNSHHHPSPPSPPTAHDSPTLGPSAPTALGGLIRSHLRQGSDRSSIAPPPSPGLAPAAATETNRERPDSSALLSTRTPSHYAGSVHSNPFEYDDWTKESRADSPEPPPPAPVQTQTTAQSNMLSMSTRAKQMLGQATALSAREAENNQSQSRNHDNSSSNSNNNHHEQHKPAAAGESTNSSGQQEAAPGGHNRGGSSETQMDREEFANELAERRRKVQEKLRGMTDGDSKPGSPGGPGQRFQDRGMGKAGPPGPKAMPDKKGVPKHLRVLGVDSTAVNSSSPSPPTKEPPSRADDERPPPRDSGRQTPRSASPHVGSSHPNRGQPAHPLPHPQPHPQGPPPPVPTPRAQPTPRSSRDDVPDSHSPYNGRKPERRDRSGSESSGRSKSRPRYSENLESVEETIENQIRSLAAEQPSAPKSTRPPSHSVPSSARPSLDSSDHSLSGSYSVTVNTGVGGGSGGGAGGRFRSNSRPAAPTHLDAIPDSSACMQGVHPAFIGTSPRPSPVTPYSANTTPPLFETSPNSSPATTPGGAVHGNGLSHYSHSQLNGYGQQRLQNQGQGQGQAQGGLAGHKRVVDKSQISEPTLVSSTSNVPTVGLPAGASLSNGSSTPSSSISSGPTPPIPPMNPRRRQTAAQNIRATFHRSNSSDNARVDSSLPQPPTSAGPSSGHGSRHWEEEHSTFSDEEKHPRHRPRHRLRKISSEGGNLNAKARQQAFRAESPAVPPVPKDGGMF